MPLSKLHCLVRLWSHVDDVRRGSFPIYTSSVDCVNIRKWFLGNYTIHSVRLRIIWVGFRPWLFEERIGSGHHSILSQFDYCRTSTCQKWHHMPHCLCWFSQVAHHTAFVHYVFLHIFNNPGSSSDWYFVFTVCDWTSHAQLYTHNNISVE